MWQDGLLPFEVRYGIIYEIYVLRGTPAMRKWLDELLPKYARMPMLAMLALNMLAFYGTRPLTAGLLHHRMETALDAAIPFVPGFAFIYVLAFLQWLVGYIVIARDSREACFSVFSGEMISKAICLTIFILYPTTMARPEVTGSGPGAALVRLLYALDSPDNLFPSIHCLESWICFRGAVNLRRVGPGYKWGSLVFTLLVCASVVLIKQHCVLDILGGVALAELGQLLGRLTHADRIFWRLERV